jgi:hypothetical protein
VSGALLGGEPGGHAGQDLHANSKRLLIDLETG